MSWRTSAGNYSRAEVEARIRQAAQGLRNLGVKPGEFWALRGFSALDGFALILGGIWQGAVMLPLPDRLPDAVHQEMLKQVPLKGCLDDFMWPAEGLTGPMDFDPEAPALGIFTSGSTGTPKAILHSWKSLCASALATNAFYGFEAGMSWLLSLDLAHIGGFQIALRSWLADGACWHLAEPKALDAILRHETPDILSLVPTQLYRLMNDPLIRERLKQARAIVIGGAAASMELVDQALAADLPISISYGSSETAAQCAALRPGERPRESGDVGRLFPAWEYRSRGDVLWIRGAASCLGHYQEQRFTAAVDAEGWMELPDRIHCEEGRLTILGRADGIFQVAGENVAPADIVRPLEELRRTADFIALPWADPEYGTIPALVVRSPEKPDVDAILRLCRKHLSGVQRPRRIYWHASDEVGKPSRRAYEKALPQLPLVWSQDLGSI